MSTILTAGHNHESPFPAEVVDGIAVVTPSGEIREKPETLLGDKGFSSRKNRDALECRDIKPVIPYSKNQAGYDLPFDRETYKHRNVIERHFGHLKECRRVATRYEKLGVRYLAVVMIADIRRLLIKAEKLFFNTA